MEHKIRESKFLVLLSTKMLIMENFIMKEEEEMI